MVAANSSKVSRAPLYLGTPLRDLCAFAYGAITLSRQPFQTVSLTPDFVTLCWWAAPTCRSHDPPYATPAAYTYEVWALPISLAATAGITSVFSSCGY